jgi:hypothetical protein
MENMEKFEYAAKNRIRFQSKKGLINAEDCYQLTLKELDEIGLKIQSQTKSSSISLLSKVSQKGDTRLKVSLEIIKHIIAIKETEIENREAEIENKIKLEKYIELLERKQDEVKEGLSIEEIKSQILELQKKK